MRKLPISFLAFIAIVFLITSCSEPGDTGDQETDQTTTQEETTAPEEPATTTDEATAETVQVEITGNDQMKFSKEEIRVKAGQTVELTLKHVGELPVASMGHNWVLLKEGADMEAFAMDAIQAKDNDYIPPAREDDVIAHTKMLGGGETDTITFEAPAKGTYVFLCTFPGHYMAMNGKFIVE